MMLSNLNTLAVAVSMLHEIAIADVTSFERGLTLGDRRRGDPPPDPHPDRDRRPRPPTADRILPKIRAGVDRYGVKVGIVVFTAIAIYLLIEGISHL